jgi:hypothetical protein
MEQQHAWRGWSAPFGAAEGCERVTVVEPG